MKSQKERILDEKIISSLNAFNLTGKAVEATQMLLDDEDVQASQEYANTVSIVRLNYNDHGPVHMRTVALNAIKMAGLLRTAGIQTNIEKEGSGDFEDSLIAMVYAATLHDLGMSTGRQDHELHSAYIAYPILDRLLSVFYNKNMHKRVVIRSVALEAISGHMGNRTIHSLEAGVIQIADGCDMTKGRARIPTVLNDTPRVGHIHQYSAASIEEVIIKTGNEQPIHIGVLMSSEVGLFQVEEVLMHKIAKSTAKPYVELFATVNDSEPRRYL